MHYGSLEVIIYYSTKIRNITVFKIHSKRGTAG